jgi:hypothetical protein
MDWLEPAMRNPAYGFIALAIGGATLAPAAFTGILALWFRWRTSHLGRLVRKFRGRRQLAEERLSGMAAEEGDLRRMMKEMESTAKKAG